MSKEILLTHEERQELVEILDTYDVIHEIYLGVESNVCYSCGASAPNSKIPQHKEDCRLLYYQKKLRVEEK